MKKAWTPLESAAPGTSSVAPGGDGAIRENLKEEGLSALQPEEAVARTLVVGTSLSAALLVVGLVLSWLPAGRHGQAAAGVGLLRGLLALDPGAWMRAGLGVLVSTPLARVLVAAMAYLRRGERALAVVSLAVLGLLLLGAGLGVAHGKAL